MSWWTVHTFTIILTSLQWPPAQQQWPLLCIPPVKVTSWQWPGYYSTSYMYKRRRRVVIVSEDKADTDANLLLPCFVNFLLNINFWFLFYCRYVFILCYVACIYSLELKLASFFLFFNKKASPTHIKKQINKKTGAILLYSLQPLSCVPTAAVVQRFNCIIG